MKKMKFGKRGLSQVVTTLILLVVSVLLAGVVTYYATNITMTRTEQEEVDISKAHVWVNSTGGALAAFVVENLGGRDILIDKITVRGVECSWSNVYIWRTGSVSVTSDLSYAQPAGSDFSDSTFNVTIQGSKRSMTEPSNDIDLASSGTIVFYILSPDNIDLDDVGTTVSITVFTKNGQWIEEVNVEYAGQ
ncbi:hypothetical protein DRO42_01095 [Candidatus Bathyarchaeota archaeon]|nr:MAG: hypothetical protein DRO42_01095 [Candidatus Bathyarchaeota archaeon]